MKTDGYDPLKDLVDDEDSCDNYDIKMLRD